MENDKKEAILAAEDVSATDSAAVAAAAAGDREEDSPDARAFVTGRRRRRSETLPVSPAQNVFTTVTAKDDVDYNLSEGIRLAVILNHEHYPVSSHSG